MSQKFKALVCLWIMILIGTAACESTTSTSAPFTCTDNLGCITIGPEDPINVGVLYPMTGFLGDVGLEHISIIEFALRQRNNELLGHPIELNMEDTVCLDAGGRNGAFSLTTNPDIVAIIGPLCSNAVAGAAPVISESGYTAINASIAPLLTASDEQGVTRADYPGIYRTAPNGVEGARFAATIAYEDLGVRRLAAIDDHEYGEILVNTFSDTFTALGGELVARTQVNRGDEEVGPILEFVAQAEPDLLFLAMLFQNGAPIIATSQQMDALQDATLFGTELLLTPDAIAIYGEAGEGMYFVTPGLPNRDVVTSFEAAYDAVFPERRQISFLVYFYYTYDSTTLLLDTIEAVAIQGEDGTLHIGRQALRDALSATEDYAGVTGALTCNQFGDCGVDNFSLVRLDDASASLGLLMSNVIYATLPSEE